MLAQPRLSASKAHGLWKLPKEFSVVDGRGVFCLGSREGDELSLLVLAELTQEIHHGFELLHREVGVKHLIRGQFEKRGGLDDGPHEDLVHP